MKILKEGKTHKHNAWFATCECCESELRILEGDPLAGETCYNCDTRQYYVRYICPVCGHQNKAYTSSSFGMRGNAEYREIKLTEEDREEMNEWELTQYLVEKEEDKLFLLNRCRV